MPKNIIIGWRNFLWFGSYYFSIPLLFKTFFAPWRGISWSYGRGFDIGKYFSILASNLISRALGAFMRLILICMGVALEAFIFLVGLTAFIGWFLLPIFLLFGFLAGFAIVIN